MVVSWHKVCSVGNFGRTSQPRSNKLCKGKPGSVRTTKIKQKSDRGMFRTFLRKCIG